MEEGGLKDGTSSNNPSNTRPISVTNSPTPNEDGIDDVMKLAFPVVGWFVRSNWKKYGLEKVTLVKGFLFFKFSSNEGVDSVLRDGPWMIRGVPIFLNKWSPSLSLLKRNCLVFQFG
ncbi:zinc knuckle CX2CX4HX4C containing protein [Tanacetum coccineum]